MLLDCAKRYVRWAKRYVRRARRYVTVLGATCVGLSATCVVTGRDQDVHAFAILAEDVPGEGSAGRGLRLGDTPR